MSAAGADAESAATRCEVTLGPECRPTRLALDPTAWMVLEELLLDGELIDGTVVTPTSVRALGESIGMSKDAVAAALQRLKRHGLVRREDQRDKSSGFFEPSRYVVTLAGSGLTAQLRRGTKTPGPKTASSAPASPSAQGPSIAPAPAVARARRERHPVVPVLHEGQLSLLDIEADGVGEGRP